MAGSNSDNTDLENQRKLSTSFKKEESNPFHSAEKADSEKLKEILDDFKANTTFGKPMAFIMGIFVRRYFEIFLDVFIFTLILIPENYEFFHILVERLSTGLVATSGVSTPAQIFDFFSPLLEGLVCFFHTIIFVLEAFIGISVPHGLFIAILASHIICILIILHVEFIDRRKTEQNHIFITYMIELTVILLSIITTQAYFQTHEKYQSLLIISTIVTQYLCRTLTRLVTASHDKFRKIFNKIEVRIVLVSSVFLITLLLGLSYIYFAEFS